MQEIREITEYAPEDAKLLLNSEYDKDDIEIGLEIVALEMGRILEELQDNMNDLSLEDENKEPATRMIFNSQFVKNFKPESPPFSFSNYDNNKYQTENFPYYSPAKNPFFSQQSFQNPMTNEGESSSSHEKVPEPQPPKSVKKPNYKFEKTDYHLNIDKLACLHKKIVENRSTYPTTKYKLAVGSKVFTEKPPVQINITRKGATTSGINKCDFVQDSKQLIKRRLSNISNNRSFLVYDPIQNLKRQVETAIRERKTFTVCGNYYTIRRALQSRGWIEKIRVTYNTYDRENLKRLLNMTIPQLLPGIHDPQQGFVYKRLILSKLLGQHQVDFYWDQNFDCFRICRDNFKFTMVNRFRKGIFSYTSKQGLCDSMKRAHWYQTPGVTLVRHPRSYNLSNTEDPKDFINDFKLTAAMALLKWIVKTQEHCKVDKITSAQGKIPLKVYYFAISELSKTMRKCKHDDIDYQIEEAIDFEWNEFLEYFYKIVHIGNRFKNDGAESVTNIVRAAKAMLKQIEQYWPHLQMDGMMNIWILKPTNGSRGEGIYLCRTLQYILKIIKSNTTRRYIVQKYIERPLLIYSTKFDIRQWFMITSAVPLTIWIYKDCYIRFSSQLYNLRKLHESVHLTNNSIQTRYQNCVRNSALPQSNMWDSNRFQKYLTSIGLPNVYMDIIYPGMKESITGAILMNQGNLDTRKNCFELYGSDFMLTEDFKPWLIEINSKPALYPSTSVTARMCPQVLDDVVKVVIDYAKNPRALTGRFELLYKEHVEKLPPLEKDDLQLSVQHLSSSYFYTPKPKEDDALKSPPSQEQVACRYNIRQVSSDMRKTLEGLLKLIQRERDRRKKSRRSTSIKQTPMNLNLSVGKACKERVEKKEETMEERLNVPNKTDTSVQVIKSVTTNLKEVESTNSKPSVVAAETTMEDSKVKPKHISTKQPIKGHTKSIFKDIIDSIRNLTFAYKPTH